MKRSLFLALSLFFLYTPFISSQVFDGEYTIGGTSPDYTTFTAALNALKTGAIIGPTTFKARPGVYNEELKFGILNGSSATNTVAFKSEDPSNPAILSFNPLLDDTFTRLSSIITCDNTDWIRFEGLHIKNTRVTPRNGTGFSTTRGIAFTNGSDNNIVKNCIIEFDSLSPSGLGRIGISINPWLFAGRAEAGNNILLEGNTIKYATQGMSMSNASTTVDNLYGIRVKNNVFIKCVTYGIYSYSNNLLEFSGNTIYCDENSGSSMGAYIGGSDTSIKLLNNRIYDSQSSFGAINLSAINPPIGDTSIVANNVIYSAKYGLSTSSNKMKVVHNTIEVTQDGFNTFALKCSGTGVKVFNNIISEKSNAFAVELLSSFNVNDFDNNVIYSNDTSFIKYNTTKYGSLAAYKTDKGGCLNCLDVEPQFLSPLDLRTFSQVIDNIGRPVAQVSVDIVNSPRSATNPDPGAYEFQLYNFDIALVDASPKIVVLGENKVSFIAKNLGLSSLNGDTLICSYSINGGTTWSANEKFPITTLGSNLSSQLFTFNSSFTISSGTGVDICVKISNGGVQLKDEDPSNNSVCIPTSCIGMGGEYIIGSVTGADFASLTQALAALSVCGIGKDTYFNLVNGTYIGAVTIPKFNRGGDSIYLYIQAESGKASDVIIRRDAAGLPNDHHVIRLSEARNVVLRNLTITNLNPDLASGVHITKDARNNSIENCVIIGPNKPYASDNFGVFIGSPTSPHENLHNDPFGYGDKNTIKNNFIFNYNIGVYVKNGTDKDNQSDFGNVIQDNTIQNSGYCGVCLGTRDSYLAGEIQDIIIEGNLIEANTDTAVSYGIYGGIVGANARINRNTITAASHSGIRIKSSPYQVAGVVVSNNFINIKSKTNFGGGGIYIEYSNDVELIHNTVIYSWLNQGASISSSNAAFYAAYNSNSNLKLFNNIFFNNSGGVALSIQNNNVSQSDYNDLLTSGDTLAFWSKGSGTAADRWRVDLPALVAWTNKDSNSVSINPLFAGPNDVHISNTNLSKIGKYFSKVATDIDGEARDPLGTTIGADELPAIDIGIAKLFPTAATMGDNTVSIELVNNGSVSLKDTNISISYSIDGGVTWSSPQAFKITGLNEIFSTQLVSFTLPWNISSSQTFTLCARINEPGVTGESNKLNNIKCQEVCVSSLNAKVYKVGGSNPDFADLQAVSTYLENLNNTFCGILGEQVFEFRDGNYSGLLKVPFINGTAASKKIIFRSESADAGKVKLTQSIANGASTVELNQAEHVLFSNLTIEHTGTNGAQAFYITNQSANVTIDKCNIVCNNGGSPSNLFPVHIYYGDPLKNAIHDVKISNCNIEGGSYNVYVNGKSIDAGIQNLAIENNTCSGAFIGSIYLSKVNSYSIAKNVISLRTDNAYSLGFYLKDIKGSGAINANSIKNAGEKGIYLANVDGNNSTNIYNNMVLGTFRTGNFGVYGVYLEATKNLNLDFNSVLVNTNTGVDYTIGIRDCVNLGLRNNIFSNAASGDVISVFNSTFNTFDYNDYWTDGGFIGNWDGTAMADLASLKTQSAKNANSLSVNPEFFANDNLHTISLALNEKAIPLAHVTKDFDGQLRNTTTPDIGADEFSAGPDASVDAVRAFVSGSGDSIYQNETVSFSLDVSNAGTVNISGFEVGVVINGTDTIKENFAGTINVGSQSDYNFTGTRTYSQAKTYNVCAYVKLSGDVEPTNNTGCSSFEVVKKPTGISEKVGSFVNMYPNPCNTEVWIELTQDNSKSAVVRIYNLEGRILLERELRDELNYIDTRELPAGMYFVKLQSGALEPVVRRLVVQD